MSLMEFECVPDPFGVSLSHGTLSDMFIAQTQ